jgi:hypothetical protein
MVSVRADRYAACFPMMCLKFYGVVGSLVALYHISPALRIAEC